VYPAVRRLERDGLIRSRWETQREAHPPRKCYTLTASGRVTLEAAERRYPMLANLIPSPVGESA
jgi:PadR family transcriptional regulator PadR